MFRILLRPWGSNLVKIEVKTDKRWDYKSYRGEIAKKVKTDIGYFILWRSSII